LFYKHFECCKILAFTVVANCEQWILCMYLTLYCKIFTKYPHPIKTWSEWTM
jgi:hypothetical protein